MPTPSPSIKPPAPAATDAFRYLFDPICLTAIALFAINRWLLKPNDIAPAFTHGYVNDLLCLPIFLPVSLRLQRRLGVRRDDGPPRLWEVVQHAVVFSIVFEVLLPRTPGFVSTADPLDAVAYFVGGLVAWALWRRS